jgi:hypothetical protein
LGEEITSPCPDCRGEGRRTEARTYNVEVPDLYTPFVNRVISPTGWPAFSNVTLNPVAGLSGQNVIVRFRIGADESTGAPGWEVDDIVFTGITNTPFTALVPDPGLCTP